MVELNQEEKQAFIQLMKEVAKKAAEEAIAESRRNLEQTVLDELKKLVEKEVGGLVARYDEQIRLVSEIEAKAKIKRLKADNLQSEAEKRAYAVVVATAEEAVTKESGALRDIQQYITEAEKAIGVLAEKSILAEVSGKTSGFKGDRDEWKYRLEDLKTQETSIQRRLDDARKHLSSLKLS